MNGYTVKCIKGSIPLHASNLSTLTTEAMTAQQTALQNLQELQAELPILETEYKVAKDTFSSLQCEGKDGSYEWVKALENLQRAEANLARNKEYTKMCKTDLLNS